MSAPNLRDDLQFVLSEIKRGGNFVINYFKGTAKDTKKAHTVRLLKFGPINALKLLLASILTIYITLSFFHDGIRNHWFGFLIILVIIFDIIFAWDILLPIFKDIGNAIVGVIKDALGAIADDAKDLFSGGGDKKE